MCVRVCVVWACVCQVCVSVCVCGVCVSVCAVCGYKLCGLRICLGSIFPGAAFPFTLSVSLTASKGTGNAAWEESSTDPVLPYFDFRSPHVLGFIQMAEVKSGAAVGDVEKKSVRARLMLDPKVIILAHVCVAVLSLLSFYLVCACTRASRCVPLRGCL